MAAEALWCAEYPSLSEGHPGLLGAILGRAEAQVMRLACLYALIDGEAVVGVKALYAALALWEYVERSAERIFGGAVGDPIAGRVLTELRARGEMTLSDIHGVFGRSRRVGEITCALTWLETLGVVKQGTRYTGGRPATTWQATN